MNDVPELSAPDPPEQNEFHVSVYHWWGIYIYRRIRKKLRESRTRLNFKIQSHVSVWRPAQLYTHKRPKYFDDQWFDEPGDCVFFPILIII